MPRLSPLQLECVRRSVRPEYVGIAGEDLEQIIDSAISELADSTADDFMKALGSFGKAVGPTLQQAAPSIGKGAATGASIGGPWGALIGAGAGLTSGVLGGNAKRAAAPAMPAGPASVSTSVPGIPGVPATPALPTGQGAAATLLSLFQNPTVQRALMSQVLGVSGSQEVPTVSGTSVPRGAINSLLAQLLANASEELPESESISEQSYLQGENGEYLIDPASPEQQAAFVLSHLARPPSFQAGPGEFVESAEWMIEQLTDVDSAGLLEYEEGGEAVQFY